jgi:very-short-patch-repair endonuclease
MPAIDVAPKSLLEQCDSDFEREVLKRLLNLGYLVTPQVKVGPFSIDLVVEGDADRRLAIELDGDKYHTPERWADDLSRQRVMERVGWRFWRCWGSSFLLDPQACFGDLIATLNELEIRPCASDAASSTYTEFRIIEDPSKVERASAPIIEEEASAGVGDRVLVTFNDEPGRQHTVVISPDGTDSDGELYSTNRVMAKALLGAMVEDELSIAFEDKVRIATVLGIEKPTHVIK